MTIRSGKELLRLAFTEPAEDAGEFAGRLVDYISDQVMLMAVESSLNDSSVGVSREFSRVFDNLFRSVLEHLDRINPTGAAYLRRGVLMLLFPTVDKEGGSGPITVRVGEDFIGAIMPVRSSGGRWVYDRPEWLVAADETGGVGFA